MDNVDFGIVVTLPVEMQAISEQLDSLEEFKMRRLEYVKGKLGEFSVAVARAAERGSVCSSIAAGDLVREFHPRFLVLLGIAAGFPKANELGNGIELGDVVIADPVCGYEYSKVYDDYTAAEPRFFRTDEEFLRPFRGAGLELEASSMEGIDKTHITVKLGPLASGGKVVASQKFRDTLRQVNRKMCAFEMEAEGVAQAARHYGYGGKFIVIKGISDHADDSTKGHLREQEAQEGRAESRPAGHDDWQVFAARASAMAFARFLECCRDVIRGLTWGNESVVIRDCLPMPASYAGPVDNRDELDRKVLDTFGSHRYRAVLRSPASCFIFGEHAVLEGHPALCLPLPLYVYVGIKEPNTEDETCLSYFRSDSGGAISNSKFRDMQYCGRDGTLTKAIAQAAPGTPPLDVAVWSQAPPMCGLATSSAISACIARYLLDKNPTRETQDSRLDMSLPDAYDLRNTSSFGRLFRAAWKIDLAFHTKKGSGAGVFAALAGTRGPRPLLYFSEGPRTLEGDDVDTLPCWASRLGSRESGFEPSHFALVYTGHPKHTSDTVNFPIPQGLSRCEDLIGVIGGRIGEPSGDTYGRLCGEFRHLAKPREMLMAAYGSAALAGINNFWAQEDHSYLALMEACQCMHEVLGKTEIAPPGTQCRTWEPYLLAQILNCASGRDGSRLFGAKITGGGMGGDIFVASCVTEGTDFAGELESTLAGAREQYGGSYRDFGLVHFSSTWVRDYPSGYDVQGASYVNEGGSTSR